MARMLLCLEGVVLREVALTKDYTTFGRRPYSDVVIDNLAVSGEHAAVRRVGQDLVIEDLHSTNGTFVNGQPTRRQPLRNGDLIEIGRYQLRFECEEQPAPVAAPVPAPVAESASFLDDDDSSMFPGAGDSELPPSFFPDTTLPNDMLGPRAASIKVLSGAAAGRAVDLVKVVTTIGKSGIGIASITRRPQGFSLAHVEGAAQPTVNGSAVGAAPVMLRNGDLVELAGIRMQFAQVAA